MSIDPRFLATAIDIVLRAGDIQMAGVSRDLQVRKKGTIDLVTEIDLACEAMCRQVIAERFPGHAILAEELGATQGSDGSKAEGGGHCWIYDPLDGTTNYAHGLPIFCSALALEIDGQIVVGAVYDPSRKELYTAQRGLGAYLNGTRLRVSLQPTVIDSLLVTGFPYDVQTDSGEILDTFGAFIGCARAVRRLGSAALDLCYVAAGRFEGFWEQRLKPWDVAGASLMVEEAGGLVTGMDGSPFAVRGGHILATNGLIHSEMQQVIAAVRLKRESH
jgi:myo-inositol-1(or 4)-monophosphatase